MDVNSVDRQSRAVYFFPAMLLVAGLIFIASRTDNRSPRNEPLRPRDLPVSKSRNPFASPQAVRPSLETGTGSIASRRAPAARLTRMPPTSNQRAAALASTASTNANGESAIVPQTSTVRVAPAGDYAPAIAPLQPAVSSNFEIAEVKSFVQRTDTWLQQNHRLLTSTPNAGTSDNRRSPAAPETVVARPSSDEAVRAAFAQSARSIEQGKRLAERRALRSAEAEFRHALRIVAETLDRRDQGKRRQALIEAFVAFDEAEELYAVSNRNEWANLENLVLAHDTPILQDKDLSQLSPRAATEMYFAFAERRLVDAIADAPPAADGLFYLGKLHMSRMRETPGGLNGPKSIACLQAAIRVHPQHHHAANELGVQLARYGQWEAAKTSFLNSLRTRPTIAAWNNLAAVHQRLDESDLASLASREAAALGSFRKQQSPHLAARDLNQMVTWVSPQAFAQAGAQSLPTPAPSAAPPLSPTTAPASTPTNRVPAIPVSASTPGQMPSPWRQPSR